MIGRLIGCYGPADPFCRDLEVSANRHSRQHIVQVVTAHQMCLDLMNLALLLPVEGQEGVARDGFTPGEGTFVRSVGDLLQSLGNGLKGFVFPFDEDLAMRMAEVIVQFSLGAKHTCLVSESLQVGTPHIGDQSVVRMDDLHQLLDVTRMAGSHFDHGHLMLMVQAKEG